MATGDCIISRTKKILTRKTVARAEQAAQLLSEVNEAEAVAISQKISDLPESREALDKAAADLRKAGVSPNSSSREVTLIVITWFVLLGLPIAISELPTAGQAIAVNEVAAVGLALAITDHFRRKKD